MTRSNFEALVLWPFKDESSRGGKGVAPDAVLESFRHKSNGKIAFKALL
jgi:hypothetical protein